MQLGRRRFLIGAAGIVAASAFGCSEDNKKQKTLISIGGTTWEVPVSDEGEPLLRLIDKFFHAEFKEGPWKDSSQGRLLVYIRDKTGNTLVGEDLEVVINGSIVPNVGLEYLLARPGDHYEFDTSRVFSSRYSFFQFHS